MMAEPAARAIFLLGGSSDIAVATMRRLDEPGTLLLAHCRDAGKLEAGKLEALARELRQATLEPFVAELGAQADLGALGTRIEARLRTAGRAELDGIVIAAAPPPRSERFHKKPWDDFAAHWQVQLRAPALLLQRLLPPMAKAKRGRVVFVASSYTLGAVPAGLADYVIAKHAQLGLMRALATEYAGKNLQINAVSPSMVETAFLAHVPRIVVEMNADKSPLKRNARPEDVAPVIQFLLFDGAGYVTGANIPVTGGASS